jgi:energy-converting hydrogenase Eha subunit G
MNTVLRLAPTFVAMALIGGGVVLASGLDVGGAVAIGFGCFVIGVTIATNVVLTALGVD